MHILEKQSTESIKSSIGSSYVKVAIVDGVAEVQSLYNPDWIQSVSGTFHRQSFRQIQ